MYLSEWNNRISESGRLFLCTSGLSNLIWYSKHLYNQVDQYITPNLLGECISIYRELSKWNRKLNKERRRKCRSRIYQKCCRIDLEHMYIYYSHKLNTPKSKEDENLDSIVGNFEGTVAKWNHYRLVISVCLSVCNSVNCHFFLKL